MRPEALFREPARPHWPPGGAGSRRRVGIAAACAVDPGIAARSPAGSGVAAPPRVPPPCPDLTLARCVFLSRFGWRPAPFPFGNQFPPGLERVRVDSGARPASRLPANRGITSYKAGTRALPFVCVQDARTRRLVTGAARSPARASVPPQRWAHAGQPGGAFGDPDSSALRAVPWAYGPPPTHAVYRNTSDFSLFSTRRVNVTFLTNPQPTPLGSN